MQNSNIIKANFSKGTEPQNACGECGGEGVIHRPEYTVTETVITYESDGPGRKTRRIENIKHRIVGGIDACPVCAAKAEVHYRDILARWGRDHG